MRVLLARRREPDCGAPRFTRWQAVLGSGADVHRKLVNRMSSLLRWLTPLILGAAALAIDVFDEAADARLLMLYAILIAVLIYGEGMYD